MHPHFTTEAIGKFWARVDKSGECWIWTRAHDSNGYGCLSMGGHRWLCHRLVETLTNGPIPPHIHVLHRCDNPPCCNPNHLFRGTNLDNIKDRIAKGRGRKLSIEQELKVAQMYTAGASYRSIRHEFDISKGQVWKILQRTNTPRQNRIVRNFVLTTDQEDELCQKYNAGMTQAQLAEAYGIGESTAHYIIKRAR